MLDTVIQGGLVVFPQGPCQADLGIGPDGRFHAIALAGELILFHGDNDRIVWKPSSHQG